MKVIIAFFLGFAVCFGFEAKVVRIIDGDTIVVLNNAKEQIRVWLYGIDAPELKQPFGKASKKHLAGLVGNRVVRVESFGKDRYKRLLGIIYTDKDINAQMVIDGYAWAYNKYSKKYVTHQAKAKLERKGLWIDGSNAIEPSKARKIGY